MNTNTQSEHQTLLNLRGQGSLGTLAKESKRILGNHTFIVISDERIWRAVGPALAPFMACEPAPGLFLLPESPQPYANDELVAKVRSVIARSGAIALAFGGGTINDVVKRASYELGLPYICVPTAPSVDGFAAFGAAITVDGFKTTLECPAPAIIVAEESILATAPQELIASGYGDLIGKLCAGADWIIAEEMGIEKIDAALWDMVQSAARSLLPAAGRIRRRETESISRLYDGLIAAGLAMQSYKDSRPASGAEHLLSHVWEMEHLKARGIMPSHGFKVAVGTIAMNDFMRRVFAFGEEDLRAAMARGGGSLLERRLAAAEANIEPGPFKEKTLQIIREKTPSDADLEGRRTRALLRWQGMRSRVLAQLPDQGELVAALREAGCPSSIADIEVSGAGLESCILTASLIRKRYTVLDLASELGVLEAAAAETARALA